MLSNKKKKVTSLDRLHVLQNIVAFHCLNHLLVLTLEQKVVVRWLLAAWMQTGAFAVVSHRERVRWVFLYLRLLRHLGVYGGFDEGPHPWLDYLEAFLLRK